MKMMGGCHPADTLTLTRLPADTSLTLTCLPAYKMTLRRLPADTLTLTCLPADTLTLTRLPAAGRRVSVNVSAGIRLSVNVSAGRRLSVNVSAGRHVSVNVSAGRRVSCVWWYLTHVVLCICVLPYTRYNTKTNKQIHNTICVRYHHTQDTTQRQTNKYTTQYVLDTRWYLTHIVLCSCLFVFVLYLVYRGI
jgi:hypothetical protein